MNLTKVNWHNNKNYCLGCDIKELEKLGFKNSSYHHDLAPSYEMENKIKIFFIDINSNEMKAENLTNKFVINKVNKDDELKHIYSTNNFDEVLRISKFASSLKEIK